MITLDVIRREASIRTAAVCSRYPEVLPADEFHRQLVEALADAGIGDGYIGDPEASGSAFEPEIPEDIEV